MSKTPLFACASLVGANRTYATTWQWSGTTGLDRSLYEHLARDPTPFPEGERVAVRCKGPRVVILVGPIVPVVFPGRLFFEVVLCLYLLTAWRRPLVGPASLAQLQVPLPTWDRRESRWVLPPPPFETKKTILCGGSLGSSVDEERSQLR